ncbi:MAG: hypothetical protein M0036_08990, partial [Desulfobacteraceae bacterium]|nr:hypothetical protein [Desulfobacteraceae bacterium]
MMRAAFRRRVSPIERLFTLLHEMDHPFSNQVVLEGTGVLDEARWQEAVHAACEANPGSRLVQRGVSRWASWVDSGKAAPIRFVDGTGWSGYGPEGASFLCDPLPFKSSHSSEVLLVEGNPLRVVFRVLHAVMDGRGTLLWMEDIFRALRCEPLKGATCTLNDEQFLSDLDIPKRWDRKSRNCLAPTGAADGDDSGNVWKRVRLDGRFVKLLPQVVLAMAKETRKQGETNVCFNIPADLRYRQPGIRSTANLGHRFVVQVPPDATVDSIQQQIFEKLRNVAWESHALFFLYYIPLGLMKYILRRIRKRNLRSGLHSSTGTISYPGKLPIENFQGGGFTAKTGFLIPPSMEGKPLFAVLSNCDDAVEMLISMPKTLASNGRLEEFLAGVVSQLEPIPP